MMKIGVIVGSLRKGSFNRQIAMELIKLAPKSLDMNLIEIKQLPFFNQDDEERPPESWVKFRQTLRSLDGFLLVTPEYNRSIPAVLKNALDVGSRPYGENSWDGMPSAIVSASIGAIGGFGANHHLRQSLVFLNAPCMQQPEVYLSYVDKLLDKDGHLIKEETKDFLLTFLDSFEKWVELHRK